MFELSRRYRQLHVKMITSLARNKYSRRILLVGLISMIVICGQVAASLTVARYGGYGGVDGDYEQREGDAGGSGTAEDNEQAQKWAKAPVEARDLLLVLAVREFCSRHPAECDQSDQSDTSGPLFERGSEDLAVRQRGRKRRHEPTGGAYTTNQINGQSIRLDSNYEGLARNSTGRLVRGDDLDRAGSWTTPNDCARLAAAEAATTTTRTTTTASPPPGPTTGRHRISTRSWRSLGLRTGPNTYRVSLEEARRFIQAQQKGKANYETGALAPALMYARPKVVVGSPEQQQQQQQEQQVLANKAHHAPQPLDERFTIRPIAVATSSSGGELITRIRAPVAIREQRSSEQQIPLAVPKRTELSPENPFSTEAGATTITTTTSSSSSSSSLSTSTSGHQLRQQEIGSATTGDKTRDVMQCNLRSYTYRATKADGRGNTCTGLITASICYGGCDSGEIADWLFPYKKSIHKVCRHGGRVRRRVLLPECHSETSGGGGDGDGGNQPIDDSLREYHYVDARDCICKKCTGTDTNCLGTMTQPHLQTLGETVAELTAADGD